MLYEVITDLNIDIPYSLIKSKVNSSNVDLMVEFQGCSKAGLCYAPMDKSISLNLDGKSDIKTEKKVVELTQVEQAVNETDSRITSYNVCYTKLLRNARMSGGYL